MSIRQLPEDVVDRLKSSVVITSLNGVVCGLLKNSLDAGAAKINITVDYSRGNCTLEDNGIGIPPEEFKEGGGLGKLHRKSILACSNLSRLTISVSDTSRFPPNDNVYGRQGDFLASLATLSLLSVSSRHYGHVSHNSIRFHNSKVLERHLPAPPEQCLKAFDRGTCVMVRDLFGSMPVRVKQRATISSGRLSVDKEWEQLIVKTLAILLSWNAPTSVSIRESASQHEIRLKLPESTDCVLRISRLLTQASLADAIYAESWVPLSASAQHIGIKGCISNQPVATRRAQFISIGIHPITNEFGTNVLYEEVNKMFTNSSFGVLEERPARQRANQSQDDEVVGKDVKSRKGVERWPMFYFRVRLGDSSSLTNIDDILDNRTNDLDTILDLLKATCYGFLKKQHLCPRKVRMSTEESVFSTSKSLGRSKSSPQKRSRSSTGDNSSRSSSLGLAGPQAPRSDSPFDGWQRVKVGYATRSGNSQKNKIVEDARSNKVTKTRLIGEDGRLLQSPFAEVAENNTVRIQEGSEYFPITMLGNAEGQAAARSKASPSAQVSARTLGKHNITRRSKGEPSEWLRGVLDSWTNPVFENVSLPIPRAYDESPMPHGDTGGAVRSRHFSKPVHDSRVMFESGTVNLRGRISKAALADAEIVAQVDRKFILVKLPLDTFKNMSKDGTSALVMLDQHAVDERCQLEDLMDRYFIQDESRGVLAAKVEHLEHPVQFELETQEGELLQSFQSHFRAWGIRYQLDRGSSRRGALCSVTVDGLPPSILERCKTEPRLLIDLLRGEAWRLAEGSCPLSTPSVQTDTGGHAWVSRFHGCPRGIVELLHSRSCRSAVMFNDVLTRAECERMVRRVARCAFPFQCAHGRPSMAPLVDLSTGDRIGGWAGDEQATDWKRWMNG